MMAGLQWKLALGQIAIRTQTLTGLSLDGTIKPIR
jgi:hypothetical protein